MENSIQAWTSLVMALIAFIALIIAYGEYKAHKKINEHQLFSQLNIRYQGNEDIQCVIKYLRTIEPSDIKPTVYQLEIFLRFFEELGMYMETDSIEAKTVKNFFGHYLERLYTLERGKELLSQLNDELNELGYLNTLRQKIAEIEQPGGLNKRALNRFVPKPIISTYNLIRFNICRFLL
jgi:hypothetical protein